MEEDDLLDEIDFVQKISEKYPYKQELACSPLSTLIAQEYPSEYDEEEEDGILVLLDSEGFPCEKPTPVELPSSSKSTSAKSKPYKSTLHPHSKITSQVVTDWYNLPSEMRERFAPLLKMNKKGGFVNVFPQPGTGSGFQVEFWCPSIRKHVRLGTVCCPKVGALMVAAANLDPALSEKKLACRDWAMEMISDVEFREAWMQQFL